MINQSLEAQTLRKALQAGRLLHSCIGENGVWADSVRYRNQCWTRDFSLAIQPLLLTLGEIAIAKRHLDNLAALQRPNGQIPILFLDNEEEFLKDKREKARRQGKKPFTLERYEAGELWNLTPGTRDSELHYIIAVCEHYAVTRDEAFLTRHKPHVDAALKYLENNLIRDGLMIGCDWRDTMEQELGEKPLLSNNSLLVHAYDLLGENAKADNLRRRINEVFIRCGTYIDYPGNERFDPLGGSLAVLYGIARGTRREALAASFRSVDTGIGVTIQCQHNPYQPGEAEVIAATKGVVVWPFVVGFTVMALKKMGEHLACVSQFEKLVNQAGFHEYYDPHTSKGWGATEQLWSAVLFLRALHCELSDLFPDF